MSLSHSLNRTFAVTALTMALFAGNALFARAALRGVDANGEALIDQASYAAMRILGAALVLLILLWWRGEPVGSLRLHGNWRGGVVFACFAFFYSWAYLSLDSGVGTLIQFSTVQVVMVGYAMLLGTRPSGKQWGGLAIAMVGLVLLGFPSLAGLPHSSGTPGPVAGIAMVMAGGCWGLYSNLGKGSQTPVHDNAGNFLRAIPLAAVLFLATFLVEDHTISLHGGALAAGSGVISTGLACALWYSILQGGAHVAASISQLMIPVIAAFGGAVLFQEQLTLPVLIPAGIVLLGVGISIMPARRQVF